MRWPADSPAGLLESGKGVSVPRSKARPLGAALLQLVLDYRNFAAKLPKLHVVTIHELLGAFFRRVVVRAEKHN